MSPDCSTAGSDGWPGVTRCFFGIPSDLGGNFMAIKADGAKPELSEMPSSSRCASLPKKCSQCMPCLDLVRKIFGTDFKMNRMISALREEHNQNNQQEQQQSDTVW